VGIKFSQKLIDRTIHYFKKKYNLDISPEVAEEYLHSFARVFLALARPPFIGGGQANHGDVSDSRGASNTPRTL
jgi:hypothetical protein